MTDPIAFAASRGYRPFDADNHYYEAVDCVTRHLDPAHGSRVFEWAKIAKRSYPVLGGQVFRGVKNATFDPVAPPGVLADYFRGNPNGDDPLELLRRHEPIRPEYRDRDARLRAMDDQGLERCWMFPTLGMIYEDPLKHDPGAVKLLFTAFNRWLDEAGGLHRIAGVFPLAETWRAHDAVERGDSFAVTRDGHRIGELIPLRRRRRFLSRAEFARGSLLAPPIDIDAFRADQDAAYDQDLADPYAR